MTEEANKPCLVQAGQGFSVLYQGRALYSRYNPQKAPLQAIQNLSLLPGTLIIAASPLLWYGMEELLSRLPEQCFVLTLELENALHELTAQELRRQPFYADSRLYFMPGDDSSTQDASRTLTAKFVSLLEHHSNTELSQITLPPLYTFRRAILVEMSGASSLHKDAYRSIALACQNTIATFWKNRLTLTRFGRLYARNLFKNLAHLSASIPFSSFASSVHKPILVCGAGESVEKTLQTLARLPATIWQHNLYILAVDATLPVLLAHGIAPDAVVAVEGQLAIEKAYIGSTNATPLLFCDLVSRPAVTAHTSRDAQVSFFLSAYTDAAYIRELRDKKLLPASIPPLGSVGLTATYLALLLRADENQPVFVTGLDFSFSLGKTHARHAPAYTSRLFSVDRLHPLSNYDAAFRAGASLAAGKTGTVFTDKALSGYAASFIDTFSGTKNLFDAGESGLPLAIPVVHTDELTAFLTSMRSPAPATAQNAAPPAEAVVSRQLTSNTTFSSMHSFAQAEISALKRLKALLMHGESVKSPDMSVQEEITALVTPRDYLYLHFPDGYECRPEDVSFLKRIRSEIDFFLKDLLRI